MLWQNKGGHDATFYWHNLIWRVSFSWGEPLTNAALVTALCVGDLSCQGESPEEEKQSSCRDHSLKRADDVQNRGSWLTVLLFSVLPQQFVTKGRRTTKSLHSMGAATTLSIRKAVVWSYHDVSGCCWKMWLENVIYEIPIPNRAFWSYLGKGKRWVWNWAARPGFFSCSNSPMRLWEYSWKDLPAEKADPVIDLITVRISKYSGSCEAVFTCRKVSSGQG